MLTVGWVKIDDFRQITRYISKTVQDRHIQFLLKLNKRSRIRFALYRTVTNPITLGDL